MAATFGNIDVVVRHKLKVPMCEHGPCLLFEKFGPAPSPHQQNVQRFFACSVHRSRKSCSFYHPLEEPVDQDKLRRARKLIRVQRGPHGHPALVARFKKMASLPFSKRAFCQDCQQLLLPSERSGATSASSGGQHGDHDVIIGVADDQLRRPTTLLRPLDSKYGEAQYWFSHKSLQLFAGICSRIGVTHVICVGAPRFHEFLRSNKKYRRRIRSFLLDYDWRFAQFYGPRHYAQYNMLNHYFYSKLGRRGYDLFLRSSPAAVSHSSSPRILILMDPPFGALVEPLAETLNQIRSDWQKCRTDNEVGVEENEGGPGCNVCWIFPYFMEKRIRVCTDLRMCDYKVNYDNHPLYSVGPQSKKQGWGSNISPIRIFTDIPLADIPLPDEDGYRYCEICDRYVAAENQHCRICNACTSKDGRTYVHCRKCKACVKPSYAHCAKCRACHPPAVPCRTPKGCMVCGNIEHKRRECPDRPALEIAQDDEDGAVSAKKRRIESVDIDT